MQNVVRLNNKVSWGITEKHVLIEKLPVALVITENTRNGRKQRMKLPTRMHVVTIALLPFFFFAFVPRVTFILDLWNWNRHYTSENRIY